MEGRIVAALDVGAVYQALASGRAGLVPAEAAERLAQRGPNALPALRRPSALRRIAAQLGHFMALLLWSAGALAFVAGLPELGWAILAVVLLNGLFGWWQESRAERALHALEQLVPRRAHVVRGGREEEVDAATLVPGDLVVLEEGDRVPSDARVVWAEGLRLDVSLLTGESAASPRGAEPDPDGRGPERSPCLVPSGATVCRGRARAVVYATGGDTALAAIARLATAAPRAPSRLEAEVRRLARWVTALALAIGAAVFLLLRALGAGPFESTLFAIGIVVANVPEGLLPAITVTLAANVRRMARRRALVRRLSAVETLGAVEVICTDKTGTLTENRLALRALWLPGGIVEVPPGSRPPEETRPLLAAAAVCTNARGAGASRGAPDATERALLEAAEGAGLEPYVLREGAGRTAEVPFDAVRRRMTVVVERAPEGLARGRCAIVKGAPIEVLARCAGVRVVRPGAQGDEVRPLDAPLRAEIQAGHDALAARGLRMLAVAVRASPPGGEDPEALERDLVLLGLVALHDPPRPGVRDALARCRRAGIAVTLVTGDHGLTARALATDLGLADVAARALDGPELDALDDAALSRLLASGEGRLFARVLPEQKLRLVRAYQRLGKVVAVTGDGVNDAPALHAADVGVAMGRGGTDVAREAADVVLLDDDFATLVAAIEEGRAAFQNVRKFVAYVFTSNVPELAPFLAMAVLRIPPALGILQILAIDLGTDMLPALALGAEPPERGLMSRPPRPKTERLLDAKLLVRAYLVLGVAEAALALGAFAVVLHAAGLDLAALQAATPALLAGTAPLAVAGAVRLATTATFVAIVCAQVGNVFACRSERRPAWLLGAPGRTLLFGVGAELLLVVAVVHVPALWPVFGTAPLSPAAWAALLLCAPAMILVDAGVKAVARAPLRAPADRAAVPAPDHVRSRA